ncbi:ATP-dependent helicase [Tumidithrix helvetica PCC 7403]|uniref:ATP-dependent helicase n=1 Tax=Tumidithrix helvetica TaxID=3457545 RepID=UPI003C9246BC
MAEHSTPNIPPQTILDFALEQLRQTLRQGQRAMADWNGGELAVSAVPGAGKSTGMAVAAAIAIAKYRLHRQNQLVIVTFTRSAASNIRKKVRKHLEQLHLPHSAFTVNTLHGLAFSIASSHREISGFSMGETQIVSESQKQRLIRLTAAQWIKDYPKLYGLLLEGRGFDGEDTERLRRQTVLRTDVLPSLAREAIATAKSSGLTPEDLRNVVRIGGIPDGGTILEIAAGLFDTYNRLLKQQGMLDYDDMILGALRVLENESVRQYWQDRIFAVFEDEAQDSSPLQTKLLEILAGQSVAVGSQLAVMEPIALEVSNLIRVGDPNQAINSTFTTADPSFFNRFCDRCDRQQRLVTLDQAGRSTARIMTAANFVLDWVNQSQYAKQEAPFRQQRIRAVDVNDPQANANPDPLGRGVEIYLPEVLDDIEQEADRIGERVRQLLEGDRNLSIAILVRQHNQGKFICERLQAFAKEHEIPIYDVEQSNRRSRVPADMLTILQFMERPHSTDNLKAALTVMAERQLINTQQDLNALASTPEQFLYPTVLDPELSRIAREAQAKCTGLLRAKIELPLYNLIAFIAMTLDYEQGELATADKLGDRLSQELSGNYNMATVIESLQDIVLSENFEAVEEENLEDRYVKLGQLTVISLHKAKGLDWDVVFMPFLSDRICPGSPFMPDGVRFLGDYTLPEVARAQIRSILHEDSVPDPIAAWNQCNTLKQAEEFRLLYVGMTRAKRLLWLSASRNAPFNWNNLDSRTDKVSVCPAIAALAQKFPELR